MNGSVSQNCENHTLMDDFFKCMIVTKNDLCVCIQLLESVVTGLEIFALIYTKWICRFVFGNLKFPPIYFYYFFKMIRKKLLWKWCTWIVENARINVSSWVTMSSKNQIRPRIIFGENHFYEGIIRRRMIFAVRVNWELNLHNTPYKICEIPISFSRNYTN